MKKTYCKPVTVLVQTETAQMIAASTLGLNDIVSHNDQLANRDDWNDTDIWDNAGNW